MSKLQKRQLKVGMLGTEHSEEGEHVVDVLLTDQLRAELEGKQLRLGDDVTSNPLHLQGLFGWAAMVREGKFTGKFHEFREACAYVIDGDKDGDQVDPTDPTASTGSP